MEQHKEHQHHGHGHERRSSLRLSDLHRIVESAVPEPENGEHKHAPKHGSHAHAEHEKSKKK